ncbi:MAG: glycosyltransferase [Acidobacteriota bacterium]
MQFSSSSGGECPTVTVLMCVYNAPLRMLDEAVHSILDQTFTDFEFLIVDDGSEDDEVRAHLQWLAHKDRRIRILWEPHRGLTPSLNRGIDAAQSEWIARQDADDWSNPNRLAAQLAFLQLNTSVAACGSNAWTHQENGQSLWRVRLPVTHDAIVKAFPQGNPFVHGSTMFRKSAALAIGGYREVFRCSQDYDFFWRVSESYQVANLPEALYHYRYTRGSISAGKALEQLRSHDAIRHMAQARSRGERENSETVMRWVSEELERGPGVYKALLKQVDHRMLAGDYWGAAKAYLKLLAVHPASPMAWGKLARLGIFRIAPFLREASFR